MICMVLIEPYSDIAPLPIDLLNKSLSPINSYILYLNWL